MFKKAIRLDSNYALPYTALADLYHSYYIRGSNSSSKPEYFRLMNEYMDNAFRLDSTLAYNYLVKARIHAIDQNVEEEFKCLRMAIQLNSNIGWYNAGYGWFFFRRGLYPQAILYMSRAIELDPLVPTFYRGRGFSCHYSGRFEEAETDYKKALDLEPTHVDVMDNYVDLLLDMNRLEEAEVLLDRLEKFRTNKFLRAKLFAVKGEKENALDLMGEESNLQIFSLLGMQEEAVVFLQNTLDQDRHLDQSYYWLYKTNPSYEKVRDDPRFQEYLTEHKKIYDKNLSMYGDI
jgi:Tfp pilus assembly protein PilF